MLNDNVKVQIKRENVELWVPLKSLEFKYPFWIRYFPIKFVREKLKSWYWKNGGEE